MSTLSLVSPAASQYFETEVVSLGAHSFFTYPHCNAFGRGGKFVFGRTADAESGSRLFWKDGIEGDETPLPILERESDKPLYFEVCEATDAVVAVAQNAVWIYENGADEWRPLYRAPANSTLQNLCSFSQDGQRVICGLAENGDNAAAPAYSCIEIDVESGAFQTLFSKSWRVNHFHFCPHDNNWIGFAHEEWPEYRDGLPTTGDRVWAWHASHAPDGKFLFGGAQGDGTQINTGHERWTFSDASALTVVYRTSSFEPKGVYEVWAQNQQPRLVSALRNFSHVDASRDGKWVVADTAGIYDPDEAPIEGDDKGRADIVLIEKASGAQRLLARSHATAHPYHAHPVFTPDGAWVIYNDAFSALENGAPGAAAVRTGI